MMVGGVLSLLQLVVGLPMVSGGRFGWQDAEVSRTRGHYPPSYCRITNLVLDTNRKKFLYQGNATVAIDSKCDAHTTTIWPFQRQVEMGSVKCDRTFDKAYIFTIYYYYGSNYFHLHYDMMLPLYLAMHDGRKSSPGNMVVMPTVESTRLEILDWNTSAFKDPDKYWMQLLNVIRGKAQLLPLDDVVLKTKDTLCFKTAYFGTCSFPFDDKRLVQGYVSFIKTRLGIALDTRPDLSQPHRIGIITRDKSRGRAILNEADLTKAISHLGAVDVIEFTGKTFREQVDMVQRYSVLVGVNGAGLTNALYLPRTSVAVQLVPYNASVNYREFGIWLSARGPYLEWHNSHAELSNTDEYDVYFNRVNTEVHVGEFTQLITEALAIVDTRLLGEKTEL